jgi:hypothetical protein
MRTTLDIDDDVLEAVKEHAKARDVTAGRLVSDIIRREFTRPAGEPLIRRNGFLVLPRRGGVITSELVKRLADDER